MSAFATHATQSRKSILTVLTVVAVLLATVAGVRELPSAGAQNPAPVQFGQPSVANTDGSPITGDSQLAERDRVTLTFPWTATGQIEDGQQMTIKFPNEIALPGSNDSISFFVGGTKAGECKVDAAAQSLGCTFNDSLSRLDQVEGEVSLNVGLKEVPGPNWQFMTVPGNEPLALPIPGGKVAPYVLPEGKEDFLSKYGNIDYNGNPRIINWTIIVPAESFVASADPSKNNPDITYPAQQVVITDRLTSNNHDYVKTEGKGFVAYVYQENLDRTEQTWPNADPVLIENERGFTVVVTPPADGWKPGWDLKVAYQTEYNGEGYPKNGEMFENIAQTLVTDAAGNVQVTNAEDRNPKDHTYDSASAASGVGVERGSFEITKEVVGGGVGDDCLEKAKERTFAVAITINVQESAKADFAFEETKKATDSEPNNGVIT